MERGSRTVLLGQHSFSGCSPAQFNCPNRALQIRAYPHEEHSLLGYKLLTSRAARNGARTNVRRASSRRRDGMSSWDLVNPHNQPCNNLHSTTMGSASSKTAKTAATGAARRQYPQRVPPPPPPRQPTASRASQSNPQASSSRDEGTTLRHNKSIEHLVIQT
jgi:hypothetical protein